jgi:transcriptional antiterminator NusG
MAATETATKPARWYVVHVYSGFEKKVMESIREKAEKMKIADQFQEIMIPTEAVTEIRRGQKVNTERKFFPGYVLVKMNLTDESWHLVRNTPKVTAFLGGSGKPVPISEAEAARLIDQMKEGADKPRRPSVRYDIGENVRVADGPFTSFTGVVEEVDEERSRLKVAVSIFGRSTPVELEYAQVEKV